MSRVKVKNAAVAAFFNLLAGAAVLWYLLNNSGFRNFAKEIVYMSGFPSCPNPEEGLAVLNKKMFVDGKPAADASYKWGRDNKLILETYDITRLFDYATGFYADFPLDTEFDFGKSPKLITFSGEGFSGVISREWSVDEDVSGYIGYYFNRFILNERYRVENKINIIEDETYENTERLTIKVNLPSGLPDIYTYMIFKTGTRFFYRVMVKYTDGDLKAKDAAERISDSFHYFKPKGKAAYSLNLYPVTPENWTEETKELYLCIKNSDEITWGIFTENITGSGINKSVPQLEEALQYKFGIILTYAHLTEEFPTAFMQKCYEEGRVVELTYQLTLCNNEDLYGVSPVLEMYRGVNYEQIRAFAKKAREFSHPFLFRLNNEMNSDWTSYGGVNNLMDPDIYIECWRKIYKIFEEEGVNNAIWIFNPNDRDYPPNGWNSAIAYYPGNEYVHMLGVTGYNNGTYYKEVTGESWREFNTIYGALTKSYSGIFDNFPWIITEFSSSSIGGSKEKWINGMFGSLKNYPNIKAAVWFDYADYDTRPGHEGVEARPYWLDETPETLEAFKIGLSRTRSIK